MSRVCLSVDVDGESVLAVFPGPPSALDLAFFRDVVRAARAVNGAGIASARKRDTLGT